LSTLVTASRSTFDPARTFPDFGRKCLPLLGCLLLTGSVALRAQTPAPIPTVPAAAVPASSVKYTIIDRGPSLVRTLVNTPGLSPHGDLAVWDHPQASLIQGIVFHGKESLPILGEKDFSLVFPADINDSLTVVGSLQIPQDLRFTRAFQWSDNHLEMLDSIGGTYSAANAINEAGEIVGSADAGTGERHAVLWQVKSDHKLEARDLGLLGQGDFSDARDINNHSDIVGEANIVPKGKPRAFLWHDGRMKQLTNLPGGTFCSAQAINDKGEITGWCDVPNGTSHGVIWKNGHITDLGSLGDDDSPSTALDINSKGQVVGTSEISDSKLRAFLWQNGQLLNLNQAVPPKSGWLLLVASRINDRGEIAGRGFFHGSIHAFLLQPVLPKSN
jgi:probable HAF family extracellular repeat protein